VGPEPRRPSGALTVAQRRARSQPAPLKASRIERQGSDGLKKATTVIKSIATSYRNLQVYNRTGGTIPVVATLDRLLKAPMLLMGIGLSDENAHTPNEKLDLDNLHHGMLSAAYLFEELAEAGKGKA
jgi:acetylornithine deacetylase/succinyl-diaminopimelate desuccinylase-like protein